MSPKTDIGDMFQQSKVDSKLSWRKEAFGHTLPTHARTHTRARIPSFSFFIPLQSLAIGRGE